MRRRAFREFFYCAGLALFFIAGCNHDSTVVLRSNFSRILTDICKTEYQTYVSCREAGDTIWVYLPYTPGRSGVAGTKQEVNDLYIEYAISSFNPFKVADPPELKFLVQRLIGEIRQLLLRSRRPYTFFVVVVTDINDILNPGEDWYIGYFPDVAKYEVGKDFAGEGYSRLVWYRQKIAIVVDPQGNKVAESYQDSKGEHVKYHEITLAEFVEKQIKWRIYKRFSISYNKTPFDLTAEEKKEAVINIVKTVLGAYNFKESGNIYLKDSSFLEGEKRFTGHPREYYERYETKEVSRKPAF